jgi:hypothetical protein
VSRRRRSADGAGPSAGEPATHCAVLDAAGDHDNVAARHKTIERGGGELIDVEPGVWSALRALFGRSRSRCEDGSDCANRTKSRGLGAFVRGPLGCAQLRLLSRCSFSRLRKQDSNSTVLRSQRPGNNREGCQAEGHGHMPERVARKASAMLLRPSWEENAHMGPLLSSRSRGKPGLVFIFRPATRPRAPSRRGSAANRSSHPGSWPLREAGSQPAPCAHACRPSSASASK